MYAVQTLTQFLKLTISNRRMQTLAKSLTGTARASTFTVIRLSIAESGFRSLYTGLSASLLRQMSYSMVRLGSYEEMKRRLAEAGTSSTWKLLLAASLAGGLGGVAGNPAGRAFSLSFCSIAESPL